MHWATAASVRAGELKVGAAAVDLVADDAMVIGGGIGPHKVVGQEGKLRASAVVIEDPRGAKVALIACDVLMVERDVLDAAARRIERETGHPVRPHPDQRHAHPQRPDDRHDSRLPARGGVHPPGRRQGGRGRRRRGPAARAGDRCSSGSARNRRSAGTAGSCSPTGRSGGPARISDAVRPTGPFDPELPVWAFRRPDGALEAVLFNHSTHTIGTAKPGVRSPSFYGLAAQELEKEKGGTFLFFEGASGSTHNLDLNTARDDAPDLPGRRPTPSRRPSPARSVASEDCASEFPFTVRQFDEAADEKAVSDYCTKRIKDPKAAEYTIGIFRAMRKELAPHRGETRKTWIQAIQIGDTAVVGVPGEFFTVLGEEIKRRSPFRYTYVFELANDYIGYIPDRKGYELGGYQTWTGLHSYLEPGTGEAIVAESVRLLERLHTDSAPARTP